MTLIQKLNILFSRKDKFWFGIIAIITIFISFLEAVNLSLTMLFISAITNFKQLTDISYVKKLFEYTGTMSNQKVILLFGSGLILFYLFRAFVTIIYQYYLQNFLETKKLSLQLSLFHNYVHYNYHEFTQKNYNIICKHIFGDTIGLITIILSSQIIFSESFTMILIYSSLLIINWKMTLVLSIILSAKVVTLLKLFSKKLTREGNKTALHSWLIGKLFNESFRNFKILKLLGHEKYMVSKFEEESMDLKNANVVKNVLLEIPRLLLETLGFSILVATVMYVVYKIATPEYIIPTLSMYALAFYKFMPSANRIMNSYNQIAFTKGTIDISDSIMYSSEKLGNEPLEFKKTFYIKNLSFEYVKNKLILQDLSLAINKQERIALIGESGSGKSTLADIVMGFYIPEIGELYVDDVKITRENIQAWRKKIGYIPQQIYLFDGTVAENVVIGRKYNQEKIIQSLKQANIYDFLMQKDGLNTKVGEGGIMLSGGQMQRVAIARALYSDPEILVLDEATSALDNETEKKIMDEIYNFHKDKTLIVVAHRLSTVLNCQKIYKIENKNIHLITADELINKQIFMDQIQNSKQHESCV